MKRRLEEYVREDGGNPYQKWFKGIGEYKIDWGPGYRIYLAKEGDALIILFGGSTKKAQQKAIDQAVALHDEYKARKKALAGNKKGKST